MRPGHRPAVADPPTVADLAEYGPEACLAALREEFEGAHKRYDQYRGWTEGTTLGIAAWRMGGDGTFVSVEAGDLLLVKRDRYRSWVGCTRDDVAYAPRVGWNVHLPLGAAKDVTEVKALTCDNAKNLYTRH